MYEDEEIKALPSVNVKAKSMPVIGTLFVFICTDKMPLDFGLLLKLQGLKG